jgi:uncharacterized protein (PEP-CTERM system associated)
MGMGRHRAWCFVRNHGVQATLTALLVFQLTNAKAQSESQNLPQSPTVGSSAELESKRKAGFLLPGVRTALSYSSNVSLESDTVDANGNVIGNPNRAGDFVLEISPYFRGESDSQRLKYKFDYSVSNLFRFKSGEKIIARHRFQGNTTASLAGDWLWLDASGLIANTYADLFGPLSVDPNVSFTNVAQIRSFSLSPYVRSRILGVADATFRYGLQWNGSTRNVPEQSKLINVFSADFRGSEVDGRNWNWSWGGEHTIRKLGSANITRNFSMGSAYWVPTPSIRLTASAVYDQIDGLVARNGDRKGLGPGLGIDWNPYDQGQIKISAINRYYGNSYNASISHSGNFVIGGLYFNRGASGSVDSTILSIDPGSVFGSSSVTSNPLYRALVAQNLRLGFGIPYGSGLIEDTYILETRAGGSFGLIGIRNSLTANVYGTRRDTSLFVSTVPAGASGPRTGGVGFSGRFNGLIEILSANLDYAYKFDSRSTLNLSLSHLSVNAPTAGFSSKSTTFSAGLATRITPDTQLGAGLRRTDGTGAGFSKTKYEDNAVFGTVDLRF